MHPFNHPAGDAPVVEVRHLCKTFVLHQQGGIRIQALQDVNFDVRAGECVALHGPSGAGKSTLLKTLYGNYLPSSGQVIVRCDGCETDMATASTRAISRVRRECIGYVSQFYSVEDKPEMTVFDYLSDEWPNLCWTPVKAVKRLLMPRRRCWPASTCLNASGTWPRPRFPAGSSSV